jgi:hypothetical protein
MKSRVELQKARKFGDWNQSKSGVNLKKNESLMVNRGQIEQIRNQWLIWKKALKLEESNQSFQGCNYIKLEVS